MYKLEYEVILDKIEPGAWRVEAIDFDSEGECYMVVFMGPFAKERAEEYAKFKTVQANNSFMELP